MVFKDEWQHQLTAAQTEYEAKQRKIAQWAERFNELQEEVKVLENVFTYEYESSKIEEGLPEAIATQLQSRLEGIRLSAKSVSRLPNKLPVFNGLQEAGDEFYTWDRVRANIEQQLPQELTEPLQASGQSQESEPLQVSEQSQESEQLQVSEQSQESEPLQVSEQSQESEQLQVSEQSQESERLQASEQLQESERLQASEQPQESEQLQVSEQPQESEKLQQIRQTAQSQQSVQSQQSLHSLHSLQEEPTVVEAEAVSEDVLAADFTPLVDILAIQASGEEAADAQPSDQAESVENDPVEVETQSATSEETVTETAEKSVSDQALYELAEQIVHDALEANQQTLERLSGTLEQVEKKFVQFVEKSLAPIMDGLYNGSKYAEDFVKEIAEQYPQKQQSYVESWVRVYGRLMAKLKQVLEKYAVSLLIPAIGELFDESKHEPITVVEDPELSDEQIKDVVRYGYVYEGEVFGQTQFLIRPAQVIVVKNRGGHHAV